MFFLPITLIVTLLASLIVAYIINPVFAVGSMNPRAEEEASRRNMKGVHCQTSAIRTLFDGAETV
jgi:multidrug efflux pump subunit AcrB